MIGVISLFLGCICSFISLFSYLNRTGRKDKRQKASDPSFHLGAFCYQLTVIFAVIAGAFFLYVILTDQFQYKYIWSYSSSNLPFFYKVAVFWAGQEGSFLLWLLLHSLIGYILLKRKCMPVPAFIAYLSVQVFLQLLLLLKNPFVLQLGATAQGMGLNPLLQDFWMVIHPPIVFIGYALFAVPFAYAIGALLEEKHTDWLEKSLPWALAAWGFLGTGIFLGGFWAYKTLGWGGYWGWDPVENASLIPWLTGGALVHVLLLARKKAGAQRFAYITAIYTFILVLYGTYLTRSGVLSDFSVHSFGKDSSASTMAFLIGAIALLATLVLAVKWSTIFAGKIYDSLCSREFLLTAGAAALMGLAILVLIGTSTPLLSQLLGQPQSINPDFYNHCTLPLAAILLFLAILATRQKWHAQNILSQALRPIFLAAIVLAAAISFVYGLTNPLVILTIIFALALLLSSILKLCQRQAAASSLGHLGLSVLCLGVLLSSLAAEKTSIAMQPGESIAVFGEELRYDGIDASVPEQKKQLFSVLSENEQIKALTKYTPDGREAAHEPAIYRTLQGDLYLSPSQKQAPEKQLLRLAMNEPKELDGKTYCLKSIRMDASSPEALKFIAAISLRSAKGETSYELAMVHDNGSFQSEPVQTPDDLEISLQALNKDKQEISIAVQDIKVTDSPELELDVSFKPMIFLVWLGCALITLSCFLAFAKNFCRK